MKASLRDWLFSGLNVNSASNKYYSSNRVNEEENKIIVKVSDEHIIPTKYGYALILDRTHVVFVKDWAVDRNWFGNEIMLTEQYFNVKEWGEHDEFSDNNEALDFDYWLNVAKEQQHAQNYVRWSR